MPDYSRDPVRRVPAAMLAHAFATGALDRAEYEDRLDRLREDPPDLTRLLWRLPQPAYVTRGVNAVLSAPDRAYARALLGVLEGVPDDPAIRGAGWPTGSRRRSPSATRTPSPPPRCGPPTRTAGWC